MTSPVAAPVPPVSDASPLPRLTFVLGGARSGKSRHAERLVAAAARQAVYVATAQALDAEMADRIGLHRRRREETGGVSWQTIEEPLDLARRLADLARPDRPLLVDCLTLWLSNLILAERDVAAACDALATALAALAGPAVLVANEVGLGIVPENALARAFRDHAGRLNQTVAAIADRVVFMAAGLPMVLKDQSHTETAPPTLTLPRRGGGNAPSELHLPPSPLAGEGRGGGGGSVGDH